MADSQRFLAAVDVGTIQQIQEALGPAWQALLAQQYVIAGQQAIAALGFFVVAAGLQRAGWRTWAARTDDSYDEHPLVAVVAWCAAIVFGLIGMGFALDGAGHLLNPTGYAVQGIIDALGGRHG